MTPAFVGPQQLRGALSMSDAIDALDRAFGESLPAAPDRSHLDTGSGDLLVMPAWAEDAAGVKLVTVAPGNPERDLPLIQGVYVLFEKPGLTPIAIFDAAALTALRTAAISGVATRHLARTEASTLLIFGAGVQAAAHLEAMAAERPIETVQVVSRTTERAEALVETARAIGLDAAVAGPEDVSSADVICTCTTSTRPLFSGDLLAPGVHLNAVGSYQPAARELDDVAVGRARVVVDTMTALRESGDLLSPIDNGTLDPQDVTDLATVVSEKRGRVSESEITIFKSVGAAFEDLVVARAAAQRL